MAKVSTLNEDFTSIRKALNLTQNSFSLLIGCSEHAISDIENGGKITKDTMSNTYVKLSYILSLAHHKDISLKESEISFIDAFCKKLLAEINKGSNPEKIIKR